MSDCEKGNCTHQPEIPEDASKIRQWLATLDDRPLLIGEGEEYDSAIIGIGYRCAQQPVILYDRVRLALCYVKEGMTHDEAFEWIDVNVEGAWMGDKTPMVVDQQPWRHFD